MVVGESAPVEETDSHVPPSPQQLKRPWYTNIGRSKKKEFTLEDDEVMKPRPALPSFGSIREKKARGTEERPLVRPHEPAHSPAMPSSPELRPSSPSAPSDAEAPDELSLGPSTDRAIGLTLAKEQALRNEANISRFREPLPPVVTSIEGSGYVSDSTQTSDSEAELASSVADTSDAEPITSTQTTQLESHDNSQNGSTVLEHKTPVNTEVTPDLTHLPPEEVPEITIIQPSPMASQYTIRADASAVPQYFDVPGGFPEDELDANRHTQTTSKKDEPNTANTATPADAIFEPMAHVHPVQPETLPQTTLATTAPVGAEDDNATDESDESIYSDAYEDLSDIDGEGFMSLDAVIESPINKIATSQLHELPGDTPAQANSEELKLQTAKQPPVAARSPEPPRDVNDWELAKIFWRSLTAEKRLQLEQEAMEEAGAEGDREEVALPIRRNNSRKKTAHQKQPEAESQPRHSKPPSSSAPPASADRIHAIYPKPKDKDESLSPAPKSSQIRTTMRGEQSSQSSTGMRKTLRTNAGTGHAGQSSPGSATTQHNKTDHVPSGSRQHQNNKGHTMPITASENAMSKVKPTLQRRGSDASDSSFKRRRATQSGGLAFRSTMRPFSNINSTDATKGSRRFSLRSLSPSGSSFRGSSANNAAGIPSTMMRRTLRSNSLSSQEGKHFSIPFPSLGRFSKAPATKRSKRLSRFGDSSDEDGEGGAPGFRSRFDDSSDEESIRPSSSSHANPLTRGTLRGSVPPSGGFQKSTPVPEVAEDSPDLPDSDDDEMPSPLQSPPGRAAVAARTGVVRSNSEALGTSTLTRSRSGRGGFTTSISAPTMSTKDKRRNSLFSILHRNKRADQTGKIQRAELTESAARRDTKLERDTGLLKDIRGEQPHSPRLQKRASTKQNGSWPLSESQEMQRSSSAGNLGSQDSTSATQRPGPSSRRSTSLALPTTYHEDDDAIVDGLGQKKKKKFGALRRIFRLDD
ncbi:hypothetical protein F4779DRAFT_607543 [Xylariaceae sp. FL0662B]|nr:hypothetical protein F4779DRAFT_607543 [Xylariaceae sp. FL0662B]